MAETQTFVDIVAKIKFKLKGTTCKIYYPTELERKVLVKKYPWLKHEFEQNIVLTYAGDLHACGPCKAFMPSKYHNAYPGSDIMTTYYGSDIVPMCHTCWSDIDID